MCYCGITNGIFVVFFFRQLNFRYEFGDIHSDRTAGQLMIKERVLLTVCVNWRPVDTPSRHGMRDIFGRFSMPADLQSPRGHAIRHFIAYMACAGRTLSALIEIYAAIWKSSIVHIYWVINVCQHLIAYCFRDFIERSHGKLRCGSEFRRDFFVGRQNFSSLVPLTCT